LIIRTVSSEQTSKRIFVEPIDPLMISSTSLLLFLCSLCLLDNAAAQIGVEGRCEFGPDALTNEFGKSIPRTCIDVPVGDDGSTTAVQQRCYYTYVPDSDSCSSSPQKVPLVVDVHGVSGCPLSSANYTGWREKADEECFVVMWPSGEIDRISGESCFNTPGFLKSDDFGTKGSNDVITPPCCCGDDGVMIAFMNSEEETDDPLFLKMAIDSVVESFESTNDALSIDVSRIYMAGHSNGCVMSLAMAALYSDTIAAVCCHAGALVTPFPEDYTPVPIWLVAGMLDLMTPYEGSPVPLWIPGIGKLGLWSMDQTMDYLAKQNDCSEEEENDFYDENELLVGTVFKRTDCRHNASIEVVALTEVGHTPYKLSPLIEQRLTNMWDYCVPTKIDTTTLAWEFCSAHVLSPSVESSAPPSLVSSAVAVLLGILVATPIVGCLV